MTSVPLDPRAQAPADSVDRTWADPKRGLWRIGLVVPALPLISAGLVAWSGWTLWWWLTPLFMYVLIPLADVVLGTDEANPPESAVPQLEEDRYYRWLTYLYCPLQYGSFFLGAWLFVTGGDSWTTRIGIAVSVGAVGGIGIANAHELGHKKEQGRALAVQDGPRPDRVRPLLRRAQPWPPRPRRHPGGSGQLAHGRDLLGVPAPHACSAACVRDGSSRRTGCAPRAGGSWSIRNDVLNAWAHDGRALRRHHRRVRARRCCRSW